MSLFSDVPVTTLRSTVNTVLSKYEKRLPQLYVPLLERLSRDALNLIDANTSISSTAEMWEANAATLRALLLPVPKPTIGLPAPNIYWNYSSNNNYCGDEKLQDESASYSSGEALVAHLARDWSEHGRSPRARTYGPILRALDALRKSRREPLRVFVPGAGACRLAWELARQGDRVEANDASPLMLIAARTLLSSTAGQQHRLYPRAACAGGLAPRSACKRAASVPDDESLVGRQSSSKRREQLEAAAQRLTLHAGSWCADADGTRANASFDAVATSYFLDTQADVVAAVRRIHSLLKPGGVWVNVGPLHWHHVSAGMLRLPLDELLTLVEGVGFERVRSRRLGAVPYLESAPSSWLPWRGGLRRAVEAGDEWHDVAFWQASVPC